MQQQEPSLSNQQRNESRAYQVFDLDNQGADKKVVSDRHFSFHTGKIAFSITSVVFVVLFIYAILQQFVGDHLSPLYPYSYYWSFTLYSIFFVFVIFANIFVWWKKK